MEGNGRKDKSIHKQRLVDVKDSQSTRGDSLYNLLEVFPCT